MDDAWRCAVRSACLWAERWWLCVCVCVCVRKKGVCFGPHSRVAQVCTSGPPFSAPGRPQPCCRPRGFQKVANMNAPRVAPRPVTQNATHQKPPRQRLARALCSCRGKTAGGRLPWGVLTDPRGRTTAGAALARAHGGGCHPLRLHPSGVPRGGSSHCFWAAEGGPAGARFY